MPTEQQLDFFGEPALVEPKFRLSVGLFPSAQAVDYIAELQQDTKRKFELSGNFRPRQILHVTLHHIGDYPELSEYLIDSATGACSAAFAKVPAFEVNFDHVMSFGGARGNLPLVLVGRGGNTRCRAFTRD